MVKAIVAVTISDIVLMVPVGSLYLLASDILKGTIARDRISLYIGGTVAALLLIILTSYFQYNATFLSTYIESGVRRRTLAEKLRKLPLSFFGKKDLADLTNTIMGDCAWLETASSHFIPELIGAMISTTIVVISLFFFDLRMTLAAVWVLPVAFLVVFAARPITMRFNCRDESQEGLETLRDLKSYNATETYMVGLNQKIKAVESHSVSSEFVNAVFVCSAQMILKLGIGVVALTGGILFSRGEISALTFFMYLLVVSRMYDPFQVALQNLSAVIATDTQCKRMDEILSHKEQEGREDMDYQGYDICFDHVGFSYEDGEQVLRDVSFTAKQGEVTALIGPSGGGKTTVSRLAARFWDADRGTITVGGMNVSGIDPETLLSLYSIVFQDVTLFNNTVMENIRIGRKDATDEEVLAAAKLAHCDEFIEKLPQGYYTRVEERGAGMSAGEKQLLSFARIVLADPRIIILDEATSAIDTKTELLVQKALASLLKGRTSFVIAHRLSTIRNADCIMVVSGGGIAESGTHKELMEKHGIYYELNRSQLIGLSQNADD